MPDHWIQTAIHHHGAFKKKAQAAGKTTEQFAEEHQHASGVLGHQARLAKTLMHLHKHNPPPERELTKPAPQQEPA
jgi:hypothetical protein